MAKMEIFFITITTYVSVSCFHFLLVLTGKYVQGAVLFKSFLDSSYWLLQMVPQFKQKLQNVAAL
jgi:hypothetical protein